MKNLVIVISGPPGAGSSTIAKNVAKKLKLRYISPGKTYKSFLKETEAKAALDFWKTRFGSSTQLHSKLDTTQIVQAKKGNAVFCGKLSIHFLKRLADYKIWLDVPLKIRAERTAQRDKISFEDAKNQISQREKLERTKWKKIYGFDYFNQKKDADLVIDTSDLSINETVKKVLDFIKR